MMNYLYLTLTLYAMDLPPPFLSDMSSGSVLDQA